MSDSMLDVAAEIQRLDPPSFRDREIFDAVVTRKEPQEAVAQKYELSQARVSQIVAAVRDWLSRATDDAAGQLPQEQQLRYGQRVVRMRLEAMYGLSMDCFRDSKGMVPSRTTRDRVTTETHKTSFGDVRYLTHSCRIALAIAKLDGVNTSPRAELEKRAKEEAAAAKETGNRGQETGIEATPLATPTAIAPAPQAQISAENDPVLQADLCKALQEILDRPPAAPKKPKGLRFPATTCAPSAKSGRSPQAASQAQKNAYKMAQREAFLRGGATSATATA